MHVSYASIGGDGLLPDRRACRTPPEPGRNEDRVTGMQSGGRDSKTRIGDAEQEARPEEPVGGQLTASAVARMAALAVLRGDPADRRRLEQLTIRDGSSCSRWLQQVIATLRYERSRSATSAFWVPAGRHNRTGMLPRG